MVVYCDIGNTSIKFMRFVASVREYFFLSTQDVNSVFDLQVAFPDWLVASDDDTTIVICSVVPSKNVIVQRFFRELWPQTTVYELRFSDFDLSVATDHPERIGSDLLALGSFVAASEKDGIMVNFGTMTTIVQLKNGTLCGAIIMPGINVALRSVNQATAKISEQTLVATPSTIGRNTSEAVAIGILHGQVHAVRGLVSDINANAHVFYSGGQAHMVRSQLTNWTFVEQATLAGMVLVYEKIMARNRKLNERDT